MKLRKISEIIATLPFSEYDFLQYYRDSFAIGELGRIYNKLLLAELAEEFRSRMPRKGAQGRSRMFPLEGEIALMFLKSYAGQSDQANFVRKGPNPKDQDVDLHTARSIISTLRATVMEGSFSNQKQHYSVNRIAARNSQSKTLL